MRIESTNVFIGPNMFARFPVIRHVLDLGELENWPTVRLGEAFTGALLEKLPGLRPRTGSGSTGNRQDKTAP